MKQYRVSYYLPGEAGSLWNITVKAESEAAALATLEGYTLTRRDNSKVPAAPYFKCIKAF